MSLLSDANVRGTTVIVATHDIAMVERSQKRVVHLEKGRIVADAGGPAVVRRTG
jgi:cell division transport system ATP-binding protein